MRKLVLAVAGIGLAVMAQGQVLFTYGKFKVTKDEFVKAFNKNPTATTDKQAALNEYLDLYTRFKLKVQAAYDEGLQNDEMLQSELANFKKQIADNFINEEAKVNELVQEAFNRSQKDIHLAHVLVEIPNPADTLTAYQTIQKAWAAVKSGKNFGEVAAEFSSDAETKAAKGDLGWMTAFTVNYDIENIAYSLKPGTTSGVVKTKFGYHIFKNIEERKAVGGRRVAQILIAFPPKSTDAEKQQIAKKADSVYQLAIKGEAFEKLVQQFSNDITSMNSNGQLKDITVGEYNASFEQAVYAIPNVNDIAKPFLTSFGYHIVKLLAVLPVGKDLADPIVAAAIKEKVEKDDRLTTARKSLVDKRLSLIQYKPAVYNVSDLWQYTDSFIQNNNSVAVKSVNDSTVIFSFAKQKIRANDWARFARAVNTSGSNDYKALDRPALLKAYVKVTAEEYYRNNLEDYNAEYRAQVKEFADANMLFAIMEKKIWQKAGSDSAGLANHYEKNKAKYMWGPSANAIIITVTNEQLTNEVQQKVIANPNNWRSITESYGSQVIADSSRYELGQIPIIGRTNFQDGIATAPVKNSNDNTYTFAYILKVFKEQDQRNFEDARGLVISDYQQVLEDQWIATVKKKYPVVINQVVWKTVK